MGLVSKASHCVGHAIQEERLRLRLAAVAVWCGDQLLGLWHGERGEKIWEDWRSERRSQT